MTPPKKKPTRKGGSVTNTERYSVPLFQLPGNMEVLLNNVIPCSGISFKPYHLSDLDDGDGVIMVFHFEHGTDQQEQAFALGLRTAPAE